MNRKYWTVRIRAYDALHLWTDERRIWADDAPTAVAIATAQSGISSRHIQDVKVEEETP